MSYYDQEQDCFITKDVDGILRVIPAQYLIKMPQHNAPRGSYDNPCWCNGPYARHEQHHEHCRKRRDAWNNFLASLGE